MRLTKLNLRGVSCLSIVCHVWVGHPVQAVFGGGRGKGAPFLFLSWGSGYPVPGVTPVQVIWGRGYPCLKGKGYLSCSCLGKGGGTLSRGLPCMKGRPPPRHGSDWISPSSLLPHRKDLGPEMGTTPTPSPHMDLQSENITFTRTSYAGGKNSKFGVTNSDPPLPKQK